MKALKAVFAGQNSRLWLLCQNEEVYTWHQSNQTGLSGDVVDFSFGSGEGTLSLKGPWLSSMTSLIADSGFSPKPVDFNQLKAPSVEATPKTLQESINRYVLSEETREDLVSSVRDFIAQKFSAAIINCPELENEITALWELIIGKRTS